jgi:hypothetical protein
LFIELALRANKISLTECKLLFFLGSDWPSKVCTGSY